MRHWDAERVRYEERLQALRDRADEEEAKQRVEALCAQLEAQCAQLAALNQNLLENILDTISLELKIKFGKEALALMPLANKLDSLAKAKLALQHFQVAPTLEAFRNQIEILQRGK